METERKFLLKNDEYKFLAKGEFLSQGFLSTDPERVVRIRIEGENAWITVKGRTKGLSRDEFEYAIPLDEAAFMLENLCLQPTIRKNRYRIDHEGFTWEVDEFLGENEGLVIAEIELQDEGQAFSLPAWVGEEVTGDPRYYNANLVQNPYKHWKT
jgi:adenylate cyclase